MKIFYVVHTFYPETYSGTERFVFNLSSQIGKMDNNVKVITHSFYNDKTYDRKINNILIKNFVYKNVPIMAFKLCDELVDDLELENSKYVDAAVEILSEERPDIIHICHTIRAAFFIKAAKLLNIPYVVTLTDFFLVCPKIIYLNYNYEICEGSRSGENCVNCHSKIKNKKIFSKRFKIAKDFLKDAKMVFTPSLALKKVFVNEFKNSIDIKVINHGIDFSKIRMNKKIYKDNDKITIGYIGALIYHKGVNLIINALSRIRNDNYNFKLYGTGEFEEILMIMAAKQGVKNIEFCGSFLGDNIWEMYKDIDIAIIPSIWNETYCFVVYEALACNVPIIVSNVGALTENVKTGVNGLVFENKNVHQLSECIKLILDKPSILNNFKDNICKMEIQSTEQEAKCYFEEYKKYIFSNDRDKKLVYNSNINNEKNPLSSLIMDSGENFESNFIKKETYKILNEYDLKRDFLIFMIYKICYLKEKFIHKKVNYVIWGASNSGTITKMLISKYLPNFNLVCFVDKYKEGNLQNCIIRKTDDISKLNFQYILVATSPGKQEANKCLKELGLNLIEDYMYGYGV
ncbi:MULTISPECIES: glycosyltransferase [Clostridium]|uniref:glycosyltransferase n=1 Tax=Clostridium TaxID=1485 RepID=UPI00082679CD|nr:MULTISPECIES: glycosyltransferase [Clostridium]